jgi:hypothetical protein
MSEEDLKIVLTLEQEFELEKLRVAIALLGCEDAKKSLLDTLKVMMIQQNAIKQLAQLVSEVAAIVKDNN